MDVDSLRPLIFDILRSSDLATVSNKAIRQQLEGRLGQDLREHKSVLAGITKQLYEEFTAPQQSSEDEEDDEPLSQAVPASSSAVKKEGKPVKKEKKEKVKKHDLAADERLARELAAADQRPSRATTTKKRKRTTVASRTEVDSDDDVSTSRTTVRAKRSGPISYTGFNKLHALSSELASLLDLDQPYLSRPQVVKRIWRYVKENGLQDTSDKRYINCDDRLQSVFHTDKLHMFTMNKLLAKHFTDDEVPAGYRPPDDNDAGAEAVEFDEALPSMVPLASAHEVKPAKSEH